MKSSSWVSQNFVFFILKKNWEDKLKGKMSERKKESEFKTHGKWTKFGRLQNLVL